MSNWFTNTFGTVENFFKALWNDVLKPDVQEAKQVAVAFFSVAANETAKQLGIAGLKIITNAVTAAETTGGTGAQKLAAAQAQIATDLSAANIVGVATNVINAGIEGAVAQLNAAKATGVTETPEALPVPEASPSIEPVVSSETPQAPVTESLASDLAS